MAYINEYRDSGITYDLQDKRIEEIDSDDVGKTVVAYEDPDTHVRSFVLSQYNTAKGTGNLSLNITTNQYDIPSNSGAWNKLIQWSNGFWYGALSATSGLGGRILRSGDGYTFTTTYTFGANTANVYDIVGTKGALVASIYNEGAAPSILYRTLVNGEESWASPSSFPSFGTDVKLDLLAGGDYIMAIPRVASITSVAISKDGNIWTTISISIAPTSNIIYDSVFEYVVWNSSTNRGNVWKLDLSSNQFKTHSDDDIRYSSGVTGIKLTVTNGIVYQLVQISNKTYLIQDETLSDNYTLIKALSTTTPAISDIKFFSVVSKDLLIWTSTNYFYLYNISDTSATAFDTTRQFKFNNVATIPSTVFEFDSVLYATTGTLLYSSLDRGITWINGAPGYELSQMNDAGNTDITRILINLVKTDPNTFKLSANEVGAISAPINPANGQIIQYNSTSDTWVAVDMPSSNGYRYTFTTSNWSSGSLTLTAATHQCGINPVVDVYTLNGSAYERYYGYPSAGWKLSLDASGNITLTTTVGSEFAGMLVIK